MKTFQTLSVKNILAAVTVRIERVSIYEANTPSRVQLIN